VPKGSATRLVIVESPTKARTIEKFLGSGYRVVASMGHVRDLPANAKQAGADAKRLTYGIDVADGYRPHYVISPQNQKKVTALKRALSGASEVYIATDEDREGEAIGWHVLEVLKPQVPVKRMAFHEITAAAIKRALDETRDLDVHLVEAQETRRVLDRLVGYAISPLLWRKISQGLSAGRVQSVAVRLLVARERERLDFVPSSYWDIEAELKAGEQRFAATLVRLGGVRLVSGKDFDDHTGRLRSDLQAGRDVVMLDEARAKALATESLKQPWRVANIEERTEARRPAPPFITSTLQQEASRKLGLSARDAMRVAQGLYERGLITYMRTDSTNLAPEALEGIRKSVAERYGADHLPEAPRQYASKSKNAQEAHEAIRPAGTDMQTADELGLRDRDAAVYDLIWKRAVASQMRDASLKFTTATLEVEALAEVASFRTVGRTTLFAGFLRAYVEGSDDPDGSLSERDNPLPPFAIGELASPQRVDALAHETKAPARYTEASLVKRLEGEGIGRPSTYASILDTIVQRGYVRKVGSQLVPTFTGFATTQLLEAEFAELVDEKFTAAMEDDLDKIARGEQARVPYLDAIYAGQRGIAQRVEGGLASVDAKAISTISHPKWAPYRVAVGRYGPYVEGEIEGETQRASLPEDAAAADLTREDLHRALVNRNTPPSALGFYEPGGAPMFLKRGPYGPYLQLGDGADEERPKRISLPPGIEPEAVDGAMAQALLSLPRQLGAHPESGELIEAHIGRFGPYVRHQKLFASIPKDRDVLSIDFEAALTLLANKRGRGAPRRTLGDHPDDGEAVTLHDGRYGPYVKHGKINASLAEGTDPDALTLEEALELVAARREALGAAAPKPKRGAAKGKASSKKASKSAPKKRSTSSASKAKTAKKPAGPKATPAELIPFLDKVEGLEREAFAALDGIGRGAEGPESAAARLGVSVSELEAAAKRGRFKVRMAFGRARSQQG
jgi:DNA topoisomerase-1